MATFIEVGKAKVNVDKLLLIEPERTLNTGEETGYAKLVFDDGVERILPLDGKTVNEILIELVSATSS